MSTAIYLLLIVYVSVTQSLTDIWYGVFRSFWHIQKYVADFKRLYFRQFLSRIQLEHIKIYIIFASI